MEGVVTPSAAFWSGKKVLLTGHTGFKGAWTAIWLRHLGAHVFGLALEPPATPALWMLAGKPADDGFVDVRDAAAVNRVVQRAEPDIVIHMAAQALVHASYFDPTETFATNVMGTVNLLEAVRASRSTKAIVIVTSDKCYENREQIWAYREGEAFGGSDPYSASKGCAEIVAASYRRSFFTPPEGAKLASARAGNVIGGGDWSTNRLVPDCIRAFGSGQPVAIRNPTSIRPWQHVLEPISGYLVLAQALYEKGETFAEGWNFGPADFDAWPVQQIVERLTALWPSAAGWRMDDLSYPKETNVLRVDATKARTLLKWRPRLTISEALDWTVQWHLSLNEGKRAKDLCIAQIETFARKSGNWPDA